MTRWLALLLVLAALALPGWGKPPVRVLLIGASVGESWDFPGLPARTGLKGFTLSYEGLYDFDKSPALGTSLRSRPRPDAVILKECAAYFPGDQAAYQRLVKGWVAQCRQAGVVPILTTVCPVTEKGEQLQGICGYNDWVRSYAGREKLPLLDLEAALRRSPGDRRLDPKYAQDDGLHLVDAGYRRLDALVPPLLRKVFPPG
ncbi:MAG: SGNH/GDSL hydrolase family protein [Candidatus Eremiobacterota bacterium]